MIEHQRSPSHQTLASDGSNAHQPTRQGASRMLGNAISSSRRTAKRVWRDSFSRAAATKTQPGTVIGFVSASGGARRSIFVLFLPTASAPRMSQRFAQVPCHRRLSIDR